jgi:hypothetical protein
MTRVDLLPCGDPIADSLFERKGGGRVLICHPGVRDRHGAIVARNLTWCVHCGWLESTVEEYERLKAVIV